MKSTAKRSFGFLVLILTVALSPQDARAADQVEVSKACSSTEQRQFDFWLGEWQVHTEDGKPAGTNLISLRLGGCVLHESWKGAAGSRGESFNMFFARDGKWHQTWVDASGGRLDLSGGLENGKMVLSGTMPGKDGQPVVHEITWTPRPDGTVVQSWRSSSDQEKSWQQLFKGIYSNRAVDSGADSGTV